MRSANPSTTLPPLFIATSNRGKLRDFAAAARRRGVEVFPVPDFDSLPAVEEDAETFSGNARKKAERYSLHVPGRLVLADDSGLEVDALAGAPGVRSARYASAARLPGGQDAANNQRLLRELQSKPAEERQARFVCVIAVARDGHASAEFRGEARGVILESPRGSGGFGYDPLFFYPPLGKTFAELTPGEKAAVSHRGQAFDKLLRWYRDSVAEPRST